MVLDFWAFTGTMRGWILTCGGCVFGGVDGSARAWGPGDHGFGAQQGLRVEGGANISPAFLQQDWDSSGIGNVACELPTRRRPSMRHKDLTGMTFGDLRVLRREVNDSQGNTRWVCECACGKVIVTRGTRLSYGSTRSCGCSRRSYSLNTAYFSEPTIRNSYWAGFIAADGCLTRTGALRIALSIKDREHLEELKSELNFSGPVRDGLTTTPTGRKVAFSCLIAWSKDMLLDLGRNFNIVERKTLTLVPPDRLPEPLAEAFIVGLIDGDGSIHIFNYGRRPTLRLDVVGTFPVVTWVGERFQRWCGAERRLPRIQKHNGGTYYSLRLQGRNAERVADRLLEVDVPRLYRKWNIAQKMVIDK
jgi:hypothetical protein